MIQRGKIHRQSKNMYELLLLIFNVFPSCKVAQKSNSRIFYWFIFQIILIGAAVVFEIFYLKSFFEKRRVV